MKSHEALDRAIGRNAVEFSARISKSSELVNKWREDRRSSGAINPLDWVERLVEISLQIETPFEDATAPIQYLAERFGLIVIPLPKIDNRQAAVSEELLKTIHEFGDLAQVTSVALRDGNITWKEHDSISREAWELIRQVAVFLQRVDAAVKK